MAVATALLGWFYPHRFPLDEEKTSSAEDEVYEAVTRDIVAQTQGQSRTTQLVFDSTVLTELSPEAKAATIESCREDLRARLLQEGVANTPEFDSLADKAYRLFTRGWYDEPLPTHAVQDFIEKACTVRRSALSEAFHTDLPRTFIEPRTVHFSDVITRDGSKSFEQLFPRANGIISFSRVGFGSNVRAAIVSSSFVCGGFCASGSRYILRKEWGRWEIINKWIVWES